MLEEYLEGKVPPVPYARVSFIHPMNSQVISQALVSATNSVHSAFALHVSSLFAYKRQLIFLVTTCMFLQLLSCVSSAERHLL